MQFFGTNEKSLTQAAIHHHADHVERFTTIRISLAAGIAHAAIHVGFDAALLTRCDVRHRFADLQHFDAQFVTENERVTKERHFSEIPTVVGSTNTDCLDPNKRLSRLRLNGFWYFYHCPLLRFRELKRLHEDWFHSKGLSSNYWA